MQKTKTSKIIVMATLVAMLAAQVVAADTQSVPATIGQGTAACAGAYYAYAKMTNGTGAFWITPTNGTHTGTFTNASSPASFSCVLVAMRKSDLETWCGTNGVAFPATNSSYSLTAYITSKAPPPTNSQPVTLQVLWQ